MGNPFEEITARLEALASDVRILKERTGTNKPTDERGGLSLAVEVTGLARRTIYKYTHRREIPHSRVGGRLYFKRSELERWIDAGKRKTSAQAAEDVATANADKESILDAARSIG